MAKSNISKNKLIAMVVILVIIWSVIGYFLYVLLLKDKASKKTESGWFQMPAMVGENMFNFDDITKPDEIKTEQEVKGSNTGYNIYNTLVSDPRFHQFESYGEWPLEIEDYGRDNPFIPFDYKEKEAEEIGEDENMEGVGNDESKYEEIKKAFYGP